MDDNSALSDAIEKLVSLAQRHSRSSGIVARDVILFGTEPSQYHLNASGLTLLDPENKIAALKIINYVLLTNHSIESILGHRLLEELHAEWYADRKPRAT